MASLMAFNDLLCEKHLMQFPGPTAKMMAFRGTSQVLWQHNARFQHDHLDDSSFLAN